MVESVKPEQWELWGTLQLPSCPKMMDFHFVNHLWITKLFSPRDKCRFWCEGMEGWHTDFPTLFELPPASNETSWYKMHHQRLYWHWFRAAVWSQLPDKAEESRYDGSPTGQAGSYTHYHHVHSQMYKTLEKCYYLGWINQEN